MPRWTPRWRTHSRSGFQVTSGSGLPSATLRHGLLVPAHLRGSAQALTPNAVIAPASTGLESADSFEPTGGDVVPKSAHCDVRSQKWPRPHALDVFAQRAFLVTDHPE